MILKTVLARATNRSFHSSIVTSDVLSLKQIENIEKFVYVLMHMSNF